MLSFFLDEVSISDAFSGNTLIGEESVEMDPEKIPSAILDSHMDIRIIQTFFDGDGWVVLEAVYAARKNLPWTCHTCAQSLPRW